MRLKTIITVAALTAPLPANAEHTALLKCRNAAMPVAGRVDIASTNGVLEVDFDERIVRAPIMGEARIMTTDASAVRFHNDNWLGQVSRETGALSWRSFATCTPAELPSVRNLCRERLSDDELAACCPFGGDWDMCYIGVLAALAAEPLRRS